jgi:hypothetical protein
VTEENAPKKDISKQDGLLRNLVLLANSEIMSISITLTVNGVVLAGRLIGYTRYYDGIIKLLHNVKVIADASEEATSKSKDTIVEFFEEIKDIATKEKSDELTFMHLEKAVVLNDGSGNLFYPSFWRLKIDSVDGYMIGASEKYA